MESILQMGIPFFVGRPWPWQSHTSRWYRTAPSPFCLPWTDASWTIRTSDRTSCASAEVKSNTCKYILPNVNAQYLINLTFHFSGILKILSLVHFPISSKNYASPPTPPPPKQTNKAFSFIMITNLRMLVHVHVTALYIFQTTDETKKSILFSYNTYPVVG